MPCPNKHKECKAELKKKCDDAGISYKYFTASPYDHDKKLFNVMVRASKYVGDYRAECSYRAKIKVIDEYYS